MSVLRILMYIVLHRLVDDFLNSPRLSPWQCLDIVRRNTMLIIAQTTYLRLTQNLRLSRHLLPSSAPNRHRESLRPTRPSTHLRKLWLTLSTTQQTKFSSWRVFFIEFYAHFTWHYFVSSGFGNCKNILGPESFWWISYLACVLYSQVFAINKIKQFTILLPKTRHGKPLTGYLEG